MSPHPSGTAGVPATPTDLETLIGDLEVQFRTLSAPMALGDATPRTDLCTVGCTRNLCDPTEVDCTHFCTLGCTYTC